MSDFEPGFKIFKPKKKSSKTESLTNLANLSLKSYGGPDETIPIRHALYKEQYEAFEAKVNEFEQEQFIRLTNDIQKFVQENVEKIRKNFEIPTPIGILLNGLSQDENRDLIDSVLNEAGCLDELKVARLTSAKCQNVKLAFQNICKAIIIKNINLAYSYADSFGSASEDDMDVEIEDDYDVDEPSSSHRKSTKKTTNKTKNIVFTVNDLKKWIAKCNDPVLILIDDVDSVDKKVVTGLLQLLRCCKLPVIYLFGIIHNFIPLDQFFSDLSSACFRFEQLYSVDPEARLENFVEKVAFDLTLPIRISGPQLKLMIDYYNFYQYSIQRLLQAYKLCLIDHFKKSETIFCIKDIESMWTSEKLEHVPDEVLRSLFTSEFPTIIQSPFKAPGTPSKSPKKKPKPGLDSENTAAEIKGKCQDKLFNFNNTMFEWHAFLRVVFALGSELPERPIGTTLSDLYILAWDGTLFQESQVPDSLISSPFEQFCNLVGHFSQTEMECKLKDCVTAVESFIEENCDTKLTNKIEFPFLSAINGFIHQLQHKDELNNSMDSNLSSRSLTKRTTKANTLESLKGNLLKKIQGEKSLYETTLKQDILRFIKVTVKNKLKRNFNSIPFSKVFIMDNVNYMRSQLLPNLSRELHIALCSPGLYLRCTCCSDIPITENTQSLPDTSILYKLYLERTTKHINLNDLYHAFKCFFELTVRRKTTASKKAMEKETEFLYRFRQALIELQFLGFLKKTRKRADEAVKLNWIFS